MLTVQEISAKVKAERTERHRKREEARRAAEAALPPSQDRLPSIKEAYSAGARVVVRPGQDRWPNPLKGLPELETLIDLDALRPRRGRGAGTEGAGQLARLLDALSRHVLKARRYWARPSQVVFHMSQELLARALDVDVATIRRWTRRLEACGYCDSRPHYTTMTTPDGEAVTAADGLLYAVRLQIDHRAHLSHDELSHQWRDLDADRRAGRTAWAILRALTQTDGRAGQDGEKKLRGSTTSPEEGWYFHLLKQWAVTPGRADPPLLTDPRNSQPDEPQTLQDVIYTLPSLLDVHHTKRPALVGLLGSALARNLNDPHSRRWYCRLVWDAYAASVEGRNGLLVLAAQLDRLNADRHEWDELRNPAALLAARLRSSSGARA